MRWQSDITCLIIVVFTVSNILIICLILVLANRDSDGGGAEAPWRIRTSPRGTMYASDRCPSICSLDVSTEFLFTMNSHYSHCSVNASSETKRTQKPLSEHVCQECIQIIVYICGWHQSTGDYRFHLESRRTRDEVKQMGQLVSEFLSVSLNWVLHWNDDYKHSYVHVRWGQKKECKRRWISEFNGFIIQKATRDRAISVERKSVTEQIQKTDKMEVGGSLNLTRVDNTSWQKATRNSIHNFTYSSYWTDLFRCKWAALQRLHNKYTQYKSDYWIFSQIF